LVDLFQPTKKTRPLFRVLLGAIGNKSLLTRSAHIVGNLIAAYPFTASAAVAGVAVLSLPILTQLGATPLGLYAAIPALVMATSTMILALAIRFFFALRTDIPDNAYGMCTGNDDPLELDADGGRAKSGTKAVQPLTVWLNEKLSEYAGVSHVLTFADLWKADWPPGENPPNKPIVGIPLLDEDAQRARSISRWSRRISPSAARTRCRSATSKATSTITSPTNGRSSSRAPCSTHWLTGSERCVASGLAPQTHTYADGTKQTIIPLPAAADLPVIVAARMSLSFPILFSAIPLYAVDRQQATRPGAAVAKHWFSDGGLSSNLPLHFFDRPLTRWPTLALNLRVEVAQ
jgi:hypothetical protein